MSGAGAQRARVSRTARPAATTSIVLEAVADCPFSFAIEEARFILANFGASKWDARFSFRRLGLPFAGGMSHRVTTRFLRRPDPSELGRAHDEYAFGWEAKSRFFPDLEGAIRFRIRGLQTTIRLHGEYVPPLGRMGSLFDRAIGRRIARATSRDVLERLADGLVARWASRTSASTDASLAKADVS